MNLHNTLHLVYNNLRANPMRSFLTMLGLIIGIGSVILIMSVGAGAQSLILSQVNKMGSTLVGALPGASDSKGPPAAALGIQVKTLVNADLKAILTDGRTAPFIVAGTGYARGVAKITHDNREMTGGAFVGVSADFPQVENVTLQQGRFFTAEEDSSAAHVAVLGSGVADELFQGDDPIGQNIKIKREEFKVIGQFESRGTVAFTNQDNQVFIPVSVAQKNLLGQRYFSMIRFKAIDSASIQPLIDGMGEVLREKHHLDSAVEDDFSVRSSAQALDVLTNVTNAFQMFLVTVAAISLLVGGIGIMNIMLVAVTERFREIGLRKAVGATFKNILTQFLIETLAITGIASLIGIAGGIAISGLIAVIARALGYDWSFVVTWSSIILGVGVGSLIGLIFGLYPARKAARMDPVTALRYE